MRAGGCQCKFCIGGGGGGLERTALIGRFVIRGCCVHTCDLSVYLY